MRIGINCGHTVSGQPGCGAVGYIDESVTTRSVGYALMQMLKAAGHTVVDCTNDKAASTSANLAAIVSMANKQPLDLFVSIHFNSGGGHGTEVFTYGGKAHPEAVNTCKALAALGLTNRGVKDGSGLYVVRRSNAKAILVECCFVDSASDTALYKRLGAERFAQAIFEGITGTVSEKNGETEENEVNRAEYEGLESRVSKLEKQNTANGMDTTMIYNYNDKNVPEWAREPLAWAVKNRIIEGTGEGLNLTSWKLWTLTVIYRCMKLIGKAINIKF